MNRQILKIAIPSIVSNVTVPLLGLVDLWISGHIGSADCIGAIAVGGMIFNMLYWLCGFLRMGTGGFTSQAYGRGNVDEINHILQRSLRMAFGLAFAFILLQQPLLKFSLWVMKSSPDVSIMAGSYFRILIWGAPAMLGIYSLAGWFLGQQNARVPMIVAILQNVINILVSMLLTMYFDWKVEGIAVGTLVSQWIAFFMYIFFPLTNHRPIDVLWRKLSSQAELPWGRFLSVNRDIFLRTLCLVAVQLFFTATGAVQGDTILAANALLLQFYILFSYVMDGFAYAGEAIGGKAYGAKNFEMFQNLTRHLFIWGIGLMLVFTIVYVMGGNELLQLLTAQGEVIVTAQKYLPYAVFIPLTGFAAFLYDGLYIGTTSSRLMLLAVFLAAASFFLLRFLLFPKFSNAGLWIAFLTFMFVRGGVQAICYHRIFRAKIK